MVVEMDEIENLARTKAGMVLVHCLAVSYCSAAVSCFQEAGYWTHC